VKVFQVSRRDQINPGSNRHQPPLINRRDRIGAVTQKRFNLRRGRRKFAALELIFDHAKRIRRIERLIRRIKARGRTKFALGVGACHKTKKNNNRHSQHSPNHSAFLAGVYKLVTVSRPKCGSIILVSDGCVTKEHICGIEHFRRVADL
jgi:hypothetical protein